MNPMRLAGSSGLDFGTDISKIPDVMSLSLNIEPDSVDTAVLYIHSDEFKTINEERRENHGNNEF